MSPFDEKRCPRSAPNASSSLRERSRISVEPKVPAARITLRATSRNGPPWRARRLASVCTTSRSQASLSGSGVVADDCVASIASRGCVLSLTRQRSSRSTVAPGRLARPPACRSATGSRRASPSRRGCNPSRSPPQRRHWSSATPAELRRCSVNATVMGVSKNFGGDRPAGDAMRLSALRLAGIRSGFSPTVFST